MNSYEKSVIFCFIFARQDWTSCSKNICGCRAGKGFNVNLTSVLSLFESGITQAMKFYTDYEIIFFSIWHYTTKQKKQVAQSLFMFQYYFFFEQPSFNQYLKSKHVYSV